MDFWAVLGIKSTTDSSAIRKAYAAKLKIFHPEDDPEGFQQLRLAYENAINLAKRNQKFAKTVNAQQSSLSSQLEPSYCNQKSIDIIPRVLATANMDARCTTDELVSDFICKVRNLYNDPNLIKDVAQWKILLEDEKYWNIEVKQRLNLQLLHFLFDPEVFSQKLSPYQKTSPYRVHDYSLPYEVWELLDTFFFWTEQERELYNIFPKEFLDFVWEKIHFRREQQERRKLKNIVRKYMPRPSIKKLLHWGIKAFFVLGAIGFALRVGVPGICIAMIIYFFRYKYFKM